ncbi:MAG: hypothetical protein J6K61_00145 [Clostridia bacterium]|nr:hypothetical protein [Clostridia bacterium]
MKSLWNKNPRLSLKYSINADLFSQSANEEPTLATAKQGDFSIDFQKSLILCCLFSMFYLIVSMRRVFRKK